MDKIDHIAIQTDAIKESRVHLEGNILYSEPGINNLDKKELNNFILTQFKDKNVFFGGVNAVSETEAIGDSRRGGYGIIS